MRTGLVVKKIGMSSIFNENGIRYTVTLLYLEDCQVIAHKTLLKDGYDALIIGVRNCKLSKIKKPTRALFDNKIDIFPKSILKEFRVVSSAFISIGTVLYVSHFVVGQFVDITGITIGKGFAGSMKRHNFKGLEASHGVSISHRSHGSTGGRQDPGKVFKNKKMAGHMGSTRVTIQNLKVMEIDTVNNLIIVSGNIPGSKGSYVYIKDSIKKYVI